MKFFFILLFAFSIQTMFGQDTLVMNNGNIMYGEVKSLSKGVLKMKTPYSDSDFKIEWLNVKEFYSQRKFSIVLESGEKPYGTINTISNSSDSVEIYELIVFTHLPISKIVEITPVKKTFLGRLDANLDIGFYHAKANNLTQGTSSGSFSYFTEKWGGNASFNLLNSTQENAESTKRKGADVSFRRNLKGKIYSLLKGNFLQNDEIQLDLRATYEFGFGSFILNTNKSLVGINLGAAYNNEAYSDSLGTLRTSFEGFINLKIDLFDVGDLSFFLEGTTYPSITEKGRIRADLNTNLKYDLPFDFYIKLSYTHNFDNQPVDGSPDNDYVIQTSFGWEL